LLALRIWNLACANCQPQSAAVLKAEGKYWVLSNFVDILRSVQSFGAENPYAIPQLGQVVGSKINEHMYIDRLPLLFGRKAAAGIETTGYQPILPDEPAYRRFCAWPKVDLDNRLTFLRKILCDAKKPTASYSIWQMQDGRTICGGNGVIACTLSGVGIQFDVKDFSFVKDGQTIMGNGPTTVDLLRVILHETGHWMGFQHVTRPGDLMSATYSAKSCLSQENARDLIQQTFTGETPNEPPSALIYPNYQDPNQ
jgi:hypothetical protein